MTGRVVVKGYPNQTAERTALMFTVEELRRDNRRRRVISSFVAQIAAMAVLLIMVLGAPTALTTPKPRPTATPRPDPHAPGNFRVTALGTCTVSVAWDPVDFTLEDFNYYLSGTNQPPPAVLPRTATSHTFTGLGAGNEYWFFIYARDVSGHSSGQSQLVTRTLSDTSPPTTAPGVSVTEVG
ncbi:MAG TPA: fibronectin type III domain-containing protein, partial [Candidatus Babeliales bacterium]|nr:fibronectin type III domain-containing protein [Candidatus Babeliales bacterium]